MPKLNLETTAADFHGLHVALDKTRKDGAFVKVSKDALRHLIFDHSRILAALGSDKYSEPV